MPGTARADELDHLRSGADASPLDRVFDDDGHDPEGSALAFAAEELPLLRAAGWQVEIDRSWPCRIHEGPAEIRAGVETEGDGGGEGWLSLGLTLRAGGEALDLAPLIGSIVAALPLDPEGALEAGFELDAFLADLVLYPRLEDGAHVPLDGAALAPLVRAVLAAPGLLGGFHPAEAGRLPALAQALEGCGIPFEGGPEIVALGRKLAALAQASPVEPPAGLHAELRPYQRTGYGWLSALAETGFGGVLADDMGLGKTLQALALLVARHLERAADRPSLVIVPTSLVGTWRREAQRFAPDLRVLVLHGADRHERHGASRHAASCFARAGRRRSSPASSSRSAARARSIASAIASSMALPAASSRARAAQPPVLLLPGLRPRFRSTPRNDNSASRRSVLTGMAVSAAFTRAASPSARRGCQRPPAPRAATATGAPPRASRPSPRTAARGRTP